MGIVRRFDGAREDVEGASVWASWGDRRRLERGIPRIAERQSTPSKRASLRNKHSERVVGQIELCSELSEKFRVVFLHCANRTGGDAL